MLLKPGDLHFLIIPVKKCSRTVCHRKKLRTKKNDTKPDILVLRTYTYDLAEGAGEGLTENAMQVPSDCLQTKVPKPH